MCGIAGILGMRDSERSKEAVQRMNAALAHRGPDADGLYEDRGIVLGHTRLSIIDPRAGANQPMTDPTGRYTLVFNGEIYNYRELRPMFRDTTFRTESDTEVLLCGLIRWGVDFLKECRGMYAFAFWDGEEQELILGRDPMGIKPLYYANVGNHLVFASEIRAIAASGLIEKKLDRDALPEYLRFQTVHGARTLAQGVFSLPSGAYLRVGDSEMKIHYHYRRTAVVEPGVRGMEYSDVLGLIRKRLDTAIKRRLVADVPLGAFLSGGIDSSAVVALASSHVSQPLKTFNIDFAEEEFSEAEYARIVAEKYGTDHTTIQLSPAELLSSLPDAIAAMDHPSGDGINTYVIAKAAKHAGITVALSGTGGDELFAGYPIFKQIHRLEQNKWIWSFPRFIRDIGGFLLETTKPSIASSKIRQVLNENYTDLEYQYPFSREVSRERLNRALLSYDPPPEKSVWGIVKEGVGYGTPGFDLPLLSRVSYAEMATYLESVLLRDADQMSMAHALEVRVPFLDIDLVATVLSVRDRMKYPHTPKKLLVDALGDSLPAEIVDRPKMGFVFPWEHWMKNDLKDFCGDAITALGKRDEFNGRELAKRWDAFLKGDSKVTWSRIWHLCILQAWLEKNGFG